MVEIILKTGGAPGSNTDVYPNVVRVGAQALSVNTPGPNNPNQAADQAAAVTGIGSSTFVALTYTDSTGTSRNVTIVATDIKSII